MSRDPFNIIIKIGVPPSGAPSVFKVVVQFQDSAGTVERPMSRSECLLILKALIAFMAHLVE